MGRRLSGPLGLVALGAFLVVDVGLVGLALRSTAAPAAGEGGAGGRPVAESGISAGGAGTTPRGGVTTDSAPAPTPSRGSSSPTAPAEDAVLEPTPVTVGLVALDGTTAWRFTRGSCDTGGSTLAVSEDGAQTWQPRVAPFDTTLRVRVRDNGSAAFAIGGDGDCTPRFRQTRDTAQTWDRPARVPGAWYRDGQDPAVVGTEAGTRAKPCGDAGVVDLAVDDRSALVLCADGRLRRSATGEQWSDDGSVEGGLAVAVSGTRTLALVTRPDCAGLAVVDATDPQKTLGCAPVDGSKVRAGQVALAAAGKAVWVAAGDTTLRATGDLALWSGGPQEG
jgi:hypothetical protein